MVPLLLLPEQDPRRRRALDELSRLGASGLADGRLVGTSVFERQGASRANEALASAEALERAIRARQAGGPEPDGLHARPGDTTRRRRPVEGDVAEQTARLQAGVEELTRERLGLARDRMVAETNLASIERALVLADVLAASLRAAADDRSAGNRAERAREALTVLDGRRQVLLEQSAAARQSIGALELLDARLVAAAEAMTRVLGAASAALNAEPT